MHSRNQFGFMLHYTYKYIDMVAVEGGSVTVSQKCSTCVAIINEWDLIIISGINFYYLSGHTTDDVTTPFNRIWVTDESTRSNCKLML